MFRIRRVHNVRLPADREAVAQAQEILRRQLPGLNPDDIGHLADKIDGQAGPRFRGTMFVADNLNGRLRGFALMRHAADLHFCYLEYIAAAGSGTGGGIGGALYERVREEARDLGAVGLLFECLPDDPAVVRRPGDPQAERRPTALLREIRRPSDRRHRLRDACPRGRDQRAAPGARRPRAQPAARPGRRPRDRQGAAPARLRAPLHRPATSTASSARFTTTPSSFAPSATSSRSRRGRSRRSARPRSPLFSSSTTSTRSTTSASAATSSRPCASSRSWTNWIRPALFERRPTEHFPDRHIRAVHDSGFVDYLARICDHDRRQQVDLPLRLPGAQRGAAAQGTGRHGRLLLHRHLHAAQRQRLRRRQAGGRLRADGGARRARAASRSPTRCPPARPPRRAPQLRRLLLLQLQRRRRALPEPPRPRRDPRHRLPPRQRPAGHLLRARRRPDRLDPRPSEFRLPVLQRLRGGARRRGRARGSIAIMPCRRSAMARSIASGLPGRCAACASIKPLFLVLALGLDPARNDPTGTWSLTSQDFEQQRPDDRPARPARPVVVQEGGYRTRTLGVNARHFFAGSARRRAALAAQPRRAPPGPATLERQWPVHHDAHHRLRHHARRRPHARRRRTARPRPARPTVKPSAASSSRPRSSTRRRSMSPSSWSRNSSPAAMPAAIISFSPIAAGAPSATPATGRSPARRPATTSIGSPSRPTHAAAASADA